MIANNIRCLINKLSLSPREFCYIFFWGGEASALLNSQDYLESSLVALELKSLGTLALDRYWLLQGDTHKKKKKKKKKQNPYYFSKNKWVLFFLGGYSVPPSTLSTTSNHNVMNSMINPMPTTSTDNISSLLLHHYRH